MYKKKNSKKSLFLTLTRVKHHVNPRKESLVIKSHKWRYRNHSTQVRMGNRALFWWRFHRKENVFYSRKENSLNAHHDDLRLQKKKESYDYAFNVKRPLYQQRRAWACEFSSSFYFVPSNHFLLISAQLKIIEGDANTHKNFNKIFLEFRYTHTYTHQNSFFNPFASSCPWAIKMI